ncbi:hypothetical protein GBN24_11975 [Plesiomonas shigelloides]|uniref:hypothetical protein n=1 Tax=Plesiomonas shigelloides TaxID=703 RepID=UPI0012620F02|nr:hypothetical protein [Plesiomonas shigelloides]KAB7688991.1 hypothetical protein GBN24_11975 [Plesiomonas shigelloides]
MSDKWIEAAKQLTPEQVQEALEHQVEYMGDPEAGIIRQILGSEGKPLSDKQQYIYDTKILPSLVERCAMCDNFVPAGVDYCGSCSIEYNNP